MYMRDLLSDLNNNAPAALNFAADPDCFCRMQKLLVFRRRFWL